MESDDHQLNNNGGTMGVESRERNKVVVSQTRVISRGCELGLRVFAFGFTLAASIVLGVAKQTKVVPIPVASTLPPLYVPVTAKWHYQSAFVYFVVANAIASAHAALSSLVVLAASGGKNGLALTVVTVLDQLMVALLFSANGAAGAIGVIGLEGNSHVLWNKVCNVFGKFCHQMAAAIAVSLFGSLAFLFLVAQAALNPRKKYK